MQAEDLRMRRLIEAGQALVAELDPEAVLRRILEEARDITGARYAALGVLDASRQSLERFITAGVDDETRRAIGELPRGRGVLGVLIDEPRVLRLRDVGEHPKSYGFPPGHPPMRSFLGAPIVIRGEAWGNLYLAEKQGSEEFTDEDEDTVTILAQLAATAIENARLYDENRRQREQAERAVRSLQAARDIAEAVGSVTELDAVLELIVKRGRALVDAQSVLILLREGDELVPAAAAGRARGTPTRRIPVSGSTAGRVLEGGRPLRVSDVQAQLPIIADAFGVENVHAALLVPMQYRGVGLGVLVAFDRGASGAAFASADEEVLRTFASSAATAVAIKRSVEADRLRAAITAADAERGRWARELHDQTLQALGGLRVLLVSAQKGPDRGRGVVIRQAIEDVEVEIDNLRSIITDLRPAVLDDLGLLAALETLLERRRDAGLEIEAQLVAADELSAEPLGAELETTVYRLVQEALTNVVKHSQATVAEVSVRLERGEILVVVADAGVGFDVSASSSGFGLPGMRERIYLAGGQLSVESAPGHGARVSARIPIAAAAGEVGASGPDQVAS